MKVFNMDQTRIVSMFERISVFTRFLAVQEQHHVNFREMNDGKIGQ